MRLINYIISYKLQTYTYSKKFRNYNKTFFKAKIYAATQMLHHVKFEIVNFQKLRNFLFYVTYLFVCL